MPPEPGRPDAPPHDHGRRPPGTNGRTAPVAVPGTPPPHPEEAGGREPGGQHVSESAAGDRDACEQAAERLGSSPDVGVVVLAGGTSRRLGTDKLAADLGGRPLLAVTVEGVRRALPGAPTVVVGPRERVAQLGDVARVVREQPAGSGPAAAVLAGARALRADAVAVVAVVPGDAPWAGAALPALVAAVRAGAHAAVATGPDGRRQHLLLAVRAAHLSRVDSASLVDAPARALLAHVADDLVVEVAVDARSTLDVDDAAALARARAVAVADEGGWRGTSDVDPQDAAGPQRPGPVESSPRS
ncbi:NTP transferase domain-containing protein [Pseudokineococcus basanitobsidens]|uniref:NTP transferase domain-containing protein n=1 Tax=Pseudokineococcus basanitobsidens TaxID=1926649 RepID=A0ABU8RKB7_9ACTN